MFILSPTLTPFLFSILFANSSNTWYLLSALSTSTRTFPSKLASSKTAFLKDNIMKVAVYYAVLGARYCGRHSDFVTLNSYIHLAK